VTKRNKPSRKLSDIGSLYQWALLSFVIVTLPLVFAIIYAVLAVTNYTEQSQQTLFQTVTATESSRIILAKLISMERSIRQFQVLEEPELFESYQEHRKKFLNVFESLNTTGLNESLAEKFQALRQNENQLYLMVLVKAKDRKLKLEKTHLEAFDPLTKQARALIAEGEKKLGLEASALSKIAKQVRINLIYSAIASIPLALLLGLVFVHLLTRPIKRIGQAIQNLGEVGFDQAIAIKGPKDLTELGQHLEWLRQKLNQLESQKQQFIRNISHELKTPLATLKEGTDLLSENVVGELNTEQQDIIQLMKMGNITINDLVENLLEYQRALSTQVDLNISTFELAHLIDKILNEYQLPLRSKNITLNSNLGSGSIMADYDKLKIIISNLFSNALKFSPQNGAIGLSLSSHNNDILLIIEDQGPGIPKNIQPLIFKDFYQGSSPLAWKIKGSGLGLALVKYYLEAHNGLIELLPANNDYCGARFSLQLPKNWKTTNAIGI
jgi:two-component system sensor histidine kinase GlrK